MPRKKSKTDDKGKQNGKKGGKEDGRKTARRTTTSSTSVTSTSTEKSRNVSPADNCNDIRKKMNAHLREPNIPNAGFLREIGKTFIVAPCQGMSPQSLKTFLSPKGSGKHAYSPIFYATYAFRKAENQGSKAEEQEEGRNEEDPEEQDGSREEQWFLEGW